MTVVMARSNCQSGCDTVNTRDKTERKYSTRAAQALRAIGLLLLVSVSACDAETGTVPSGVSTATPLSARHLAVIVNTQDPLSTRIADYYRKKRGIDPENIIEVRFTPGGQTLQPKEFNEVIEAVRERTPDPVQAYVLTWTAPYRVGCMSITTAFAAGYDKAFCASGCEATRPSPYFDSDSRRPHDTHGWRPTMMLAGERFSDVKALIDRGVSADGTYPPGTGYLVSTTDRARNVRARFYPGIHLMQSDRFRFELVRSDTLRHRTDVMFYFTGLASVEGLDTNKYLPGAIADHLTSAGGILTGSRQMNSLRWLGAGATASYGAVVEPCAFVQKFPRPDIVINRYLNGETLLEAYWKSVAWPGQGVFIGEPLATPFSDQPG